MLQRTISHLPVTPAKAGAQSFSTLCGWKLGPRLRGDDRAGKSRSEARPTMTWAEESIGIAAVLVQAKDEAARAFYLRQAEWLEFPAGSGTLWLPVGVVG